MNMKKLGAILLLIAVLMTGIAACAEESAKVGEEAPDFELTLLSGEPFKLSEQRGKVVFLNLWATWCPPCVMEMGDIQKLADAYPEELVVIGASADYEQATVEAFIEKNGYTYPIAMDEGFRLGALLYPTRYIPYSVFISPEGKVVSMDVGVADYDTMVARFEAAKDE